MIGSLPPGPTRAARAAWVRAFESAVAACKTASAAHGLDSPEHVAAKAALQSVSWDRVAPLVFSKGRS